MSGMNRKSVDHAEAVAGLGQLRQMAQAVAESATFKRSDQLCRFLLYLAERSDAGELDELSEKAIGERVFGRKDFDPRIDTIVRVQARRLRQKLEEYYSGEGQASKQRLSLTSHPYLLIAQEASELRAVEKKRPAWRSFDFILGALMGAALVLAASLALLYPGTGGRVNVAHEEVLDHPIWKGLAEPRKEVLVGVSTPLFLRSLNGYVRDFRLNDPEAIGEAKAMLGEGVYSPVTDPWVTLSDLHAAQRLVELMGAAGARVKIAGGREATEESIRRGNSILLGHPRGIPWLGPALSGLNFHFQRAETPGAWSGIHNRQPVGGEQGQYRPSGGNEVLKVSEAEPDYGLVTRWSDQPDRVILSITGSRARTSSFMLEKLTEATFLEELDRKVDRQRWGGVKTAQLLFRVRYVNRERMDAAFVSCRFDDKPIARR